MKGSWKTTVTGIATVLVALGSAVIAFLDGKPETSPDFGAVIAAVTAGIGLIAARDNNVSSEQAGAKK